MLHLSFCGWLLYLHYYGHCLGGEIVTCIFMHSERSMLKDYFATANFFLALLLR